VSDDGPVARSPLGLRGPVEVRSGWAVSAARSTAPLRIADRTPLAKVLVRASSDGHVASRLDVRSGSAARNEHGTLVVGTGPADWLLFGPPGSAAELAGRIDLQDDGLVSVLDYTHGRALMRLTGATAGQTLAKLCPIDLSDRVTPDHAAFRSSVAQVATDIVRDDLGDVRSYLLHCERSSGQHLYDAIVDAGSEFGIEPDGFGYP
jgi:heterotetrameric sarcosine oxidase gamma subunit